MGKGIEIVCQGKEGAERPVSVERVVGALESLRKARLELLNARWSLGERMEGFVVEEDFHVSEPCRQITAISDSIDELIDRFDLPDEVGFKKV